MPRITKITPNLVVSSVERSIAFYCDVLGFAAAMTVPDHPPYVFASVRSGPVEIYLNAPGPAYAEYPAFEGRPIGGTFTMFTEVEDMAAVHADLAGRVTIVMPLEKKWYGVTEFAIVDPDGYVITFAEHAQPAT
jgi:catechol 2,3-dioxygenase-like lactoylglutathione lyase family enzyme